MLGRRRIFIPVNSILTDYCSLHLALGSLWSQMAFGKGAKGPEKYVCHQINLMGMCGGAFHFSKDFCIFEG